jgi:hypothetical protein
MSDDTKQRGGQDRNRISMSQAHEVRYWTETLGCSEAELAAAVKQAGDRADAVRQYLTRQKAGA